MAVGYVNCVLRGVRAMTPVEKLILVILADYSRSPGGIAWPCVETIAWEACIGRRQATAHLARLRAAGWIEALGSGRGGRGMSTRYRLNLQRIVDCADDARAAKKEARARAVKAPINSEDARAVSATETTWNSAANHAERSTNRANSSTETTRPAAHEPLNLAVISTVFSRTPNPVEKGQELNPENPTPTPPAKAIARQPVETEEQRQARIEANRQRQLKIVAERARS